MPLTIKQCHIEINSNGGLKLESYSSNNWKHISSTTIPITTKLGGVVTYHEGLSPIKSNDPLIMLSFKIKWQTKNISTTRVPLAKKTRQDHHLLWWSAAHKVTWHVVLEDHVTNSNHYISHTEVHKAIKLGKMVIVIWPFDQEIFKNHMTK